jgi:acyl-CoA dehydrogenase
LKRFEDDARPVEDLPLLDWSVQDALARTEEAFYGLFQNLPRAAAAMLRFIVFPWGREFAQPRDRLGHAVCNLVLASGPARDRLTAGMYIGKGDTNPIAILEAALVTAEQAQPIEDRIRAARRAGTLAANSLKHEVEIAAALGIIGKADAQLVEQARALRRKAIMVDDFPKDLRRTEIYQTTQPVG